MNKRKIVSLCLVAALVVMGSFEFIWYELGFKNEISVSNDQLSTNKITIYYGFTNQKKLDVTEEEKIKEIAEACKSGKFIKVPSDGHLNGMCNIWLDFNNGTVIGMYEYEDYGYIGNQIEPVGRSTEAYLPKGLVQKVRDMIKSS